MAIGGDSGFWDFCHAEEDLLVSLMGGCFVED